MVAATPVGQFPMASWSYPGALVLDNKYYEVFVNWVADPTRSSAVMYRLLGMTSPTSCEDVREFTVDQRMALGWCYLGRVYLRSNVDACTSPFSWVTTTPKVEISARTPGTISADAVRIVSLR